MIRMILLLLCLSLPVLTWGQDIWADPDLVVPTEPQSALSSEPISSSSVSQSSSSSEVEPVKPAEPNQSADSVAAPVVPSDSNVQVLPPQETTVAKDSIIADSIKTQPIKTQSIIADTTASDSISKNSIPADSIPRVSQVIDTATIDSIQVDSNTTAAAISDTAVVDSIPKDSVTQVTATTDSLFDPKQVVLDPKKVQADSAREARRKKILGQVKVSKIQTAKDLGNNYKSPKKALFYSLLLPGAGQFYVGNSTWNNIRGGLYLLSEATLWYGYYHYTVRRYDSKANQAGTYLKQYYNLDRYESETFDLRTQAVGSEPGLDSTFNLRYGTSGNNGSRERFCEAIYGVEQANAINSCSSLKSNPSYGGLENVADFESLALLLEDENYVLGWRDAETNPNSLRLDEPTYVSLGTSEQLAQYRRIRQEARNYSDLEPLFIAGVLVNHIVSAVDAAWAAHSHNQSMVKKELSWYHKVRVQSAWAPQADQVNQGMQWRGFLQAQLSF